MLFYEPEVNNCISIDNIWDGEESEGDYCGIFFPVQKNLKGYIDENGNSNEKDALEHENKKVEKLKKAAGGPMY